MPRASADKPYTNFSAGLVTESTDLNYPENSVRDINNMDIDANGSARRRLGIELENTPFTMPVAPGRNIREAPFSSHIWDSPGGNSELTFVVFCSGLRFYIRNLDTESVSNYSTVQPFTNTLVIDIPSANYTSPNNFVFIPRGNYYEGSYIDNAKQLAWEEEARSAQFQSATGDGKIFFTSKYHRPFFLSYDASNKQIKVFHVGRSDAHPLGTMLVRDFVGIKERYDDSYKPAVLTPEHSYNLVNQGWRAVRINKYKTDIGVFPSNAQQWILGKNSEDNFESALLDKQDFGTSPAPKGGLVYDVLDGIRDATLYTDRGEVPSYRKWMSDFQPFQPSRTVLNYIQHISATYTGDTVVLGGGGSPQSSTLYPVEVTLPLSQGTTKTLSLRGTVDVRPDHSFTTCAFFAGRIWFAGDSNRYNPNGVYFSKTIQTDSDTGIFMQVNDPVSEHFTDLLDTDGGVAYINEAGGIVKIVPFGAGMLVFARKGVWYVRGSDSGFKATDFSIDKVSDVGVFNAESVVPVESGVVYWTDNSIMAIASPLEPKTENLSDDKIFNFYQSIDQDDRKQARGIYDKASKRVMWFYWDETLGHTRFTSPNFYNAALIWDARTGAFSRHTYGSKNEFSDAVGVMGAVPRMKPLVKYRQEFVTVDGEIVRLGDTSQVTVGEATVAFENERYINTLKLVTARGVEGGFTLANFSNVLGVDYSDFGSSAPDDLTFDSYLVTPPETLGDLQRNKQAVYVHSFFNRTERYFYANLDDIIELDRPSACTLTPIWDWNISNAGGRIGTSQQAYRFKKPVLALETGEVFDNGEGVVYTKLKIRGHGRSLSIRYDSVDNTDFQLLGNSIQYSANGV